MKLATFARLAALATAVLAAPHDYAPNLRSRRLQPRANLTDRALNSNTLWSGVVLADFFKDENGNADPYLDVTAHFVVPSAADQTLSRVYAWIGIDGNNPDIDNDPVIQTGLDIETAVDSTSGEVKTTYRPWYEWESSALVYFPDNDDDGKPFVIASGDDLTFAISIASTLDSAEAIISNPAKDLTHSATFTPPDVFHNAIGRSAEWIMERVVESTDPLTYAPLLNFGTATFTNCVAVTAGGESVDLDGGPNGAGDVPVVPLTMINSNTDQTVLATGSKVDDITAKIVWQNPGSTNP